nr:uracil-DNA glycosylase [Paenibacillus hamazuiensis]
MKNEPSAVQGKINCFGCKHFYVTWDPSFPRGCRAFGFKTSEMPSALVLKSSGQPCMEYTKKG